MKAVMSHLYCLIDKSLFKWFFAMESDKLADWPTFVLCSGGPTAILKIDRESY